MYSPFLAIGILKKVVNTDKLIEQPDKVVAVQVVQLICLLFSISLNTPVSGSGLFQIPELPFIIIIKCLH